MQHPNTSDATFPVRIPLRGKAGDGRFATLDAADWQHVRETWGDVWTLRSNGFGKDYVSSRRAILRPLTGQPASHNVVARLARLLLGAQRGDIVVYLDGDTLNLTRRNLSLLKRRKANAWKAEKASARAVSAVAGMREGRDYFLTSNKAI